jgi:hypothetical protein
LPFWALRIARDREVVVVELAPTISGQPTAIEVESYVTSELADRAHFLGLLPRMTD